MFNYKQKIKTKIHERTFEYCYHDLKEVKVEGRAGLFNRKCFWNACQYATTHKGYKVIMGLYYDRDISRTFLHYWVRKDSKDYDVTLGYLSSQNTYFEIKVIKEKDYHIITRVFDDALEYYRLKLTTRFERFIIGENP